MAQMQSMGEAVAALFHSDPDAHEAAVDYLADLGRLDAVVGEGLVIA